MTADEKIADLTGQVLALTLYVRALIDKHPQPHDVLRFADHELEQLVASILAKPTQDAALVGIERIRKSIHPNKKAGPYS